MSTRLAMIQRLVEQGSNDPFVWYALAMEYRAAGQLEEALNAFLQVRDKFPKYVPTYLMAAQVAAELGRSEEARAWCQSGIDVAESQSESHARSELDIFLQNLEND